MDWTDAENVHSALRGLRQDAGWVHILLPEISRRIAEHEAIALLTANAAKHTRRAARERRAELVSLLRFLDSASANAAARLRLSEEPSTDLEP